MARAEMGRFTSLSEFTLVSNGKTHLFFEIALYNYRELENGNIELGVHIADVTHFVLPGSLSDIEAQSRSTTVYLADRRYDMLPGILSSNLCSLVSGVDRYWKYIFLVLIFDKSGAQDIKPKTFVSS